MTLVCRGKEVLLQSRELGLGERCVGQDLTDLVLGEILVILRSLHHHVSADLKASWVDLSVQDLLRNHAQSLVLVKFLREEKNSGSAIDDEEVVGNVLPLQNVASVADFHGELLEVRAELRPWL